MTKEATKETTKETMMEEELPLDLVNKVLSKLTEEPVCEETKKELLVSYLRQNALAALRSLPNDAFLSPSSRDEEVEVEGLMPSVKGLSEKESVLYNNNCRRKGRGEGNKRGRMSLRLSGAKRMADLPNFISSPQTTIQTTIQSLNQITTQNQLEIGNRIVSPMLRNTEKKAQLNEAHLHEERENNNRKQKRQQEKESKRIDSVWEMLSQISVDSCQNELSSASSEFFPTPPSSHLF